MSSKAIQKARRSAFIKSLAGHLVGVSLAALGAVLAYLQNSVTTGVITGVAGAVLGVYLPMARNWYDKQNANYGKS